MVAFHSNKAARHHGRPMSISRVVFCPSGEWMASADESGFVVIYRDVGEERQGWKHVGRSHSHSGRVVGLEFHVRRNRPMTLISVGEDRHLIEYDLQASFNKGYTCPVHGPQQIDETATPTAFARHSSSLEEGDFEDRIIVTNSSSQCNQYNADDKTFRRRSKAPSATIKNLTVIAPSSDGPSKPFSVYSDLDSIGFLKFPLDSHQSETKVEIGVHSAMEVVGKEGRFVLSVDQDGRTLTVWKVNYSAIISGSINETPPKEMPDDMYNKLRLYFDFYQHDNTISVDKVPTLIQAAMPAHCCLTKKDCDNIIVELSTRDFSRTGQIRKAVEWEDLSKAFFNYGSTAITPAENKNDEVMEALTLLQGKYGGAQFSWTFLRHLLTTKGEALSEQEVLDFDKVVSHLWNKKDDNAVHVDALVQLLVRA